MFKDYRRQKLKDRIDDLDYYIYKWSWSFSPSEKRKLEKQLKKLQEKYERKYGDK